MAAGLQCGKGKINNQPRFSHWRCLMLVPFVGVVHQHLKSWSLGAVFECLDRFLEEPAFRTAVIRKPKAFTRPRGLYSLPVVLKTFVNIRLTHANSCNSLIYKDSFKVKI